MRVLFFGTPEFACPTLVALAESRHPVVGVVSQPDRPRGRGRRLEPTPTKREAEARQIPCLQPEKVGNADALAWMRDREPDLGVVVAFGQFIPRKVRDLPPHGLINGHASLLPRHRGAAPVPYAILCGDVETGITVMRVEREMDAGDWCARRATPIRSDETAGELADRLAALAGPLLVEAVDAIRAGEARFVAQDPAAVTFAPKLEKDFGRVDWTEPCERVLRRIRAATPWPGAHLTLASGGRRLRLLRACAADPADPAADPGTVDTRRGDLRVAAGDGWVVVTELQVPGKRPTSAGAFLRGARLPERDRVAG